MSQTITTRVDDALSRDIEALAKREKLDKSSVVRRLLASSLKEEKLTHTLKRYKKGEITIGKAAELVGMNLREMMLLASKKGIPFQYGLKELKEDIEG